LHTEEVRVGWIAEAAGVGIEAAQSEGIGYEPWATVIDSRGVC